MQNKMHSTNSTCNYNPIASCDDPLINPHRPNFPENDMSCNSKVDDPCYPLLFNFPNSPHTHLEYEDAYLQFLDLFYQHEQSMTTAEDHQTATNMAADYCSIENINVPKEDAAAAASNGKGDIISTVVLDRPQPTTTTTTHVTRKRCSKKDRHSKINTARGPRDRRMRLSLEVARKFFDLQDLLGFDKASRTVDWLLKHSRPAIRELARVRGVAYRSCSLVMGANSASSTSDVDYEVVSSSNHSTATVEVEVEVEVVPHKIRTEEEPPPSCTKLKRTKKIKVTRATIARESRRMARERARERTSQKRRLMSEISTTTCEPRFFADQSAFSHSLKAGSAGCRVPIYDMQAEIQDLSSDRARINSINGAADEVVTNSLVYASTVFDYQDNAGFSPQHQQIAEFQFCGKPWEAYNINFDLSG